MEMKVGQYGVAGSGGQQQLVRRLEEGVIVLLSADYTVIFRYLLVG